MKCKNCEHENSTNLKYCTNCGSKLENKNKKNTTIIIIIVTLIIIIFFFFLGIVLYSFARSVNQGITDFFKGCASIG